MMHLFLKYISIGVLASACCASVAAKEVKDTLFSDSGDRIILNYSITTVNGQMAVHFTSTAVADWR